MRCLICRKEIPHEGDPFRPFCSERCKLIDLDHWLSGRYRISTPVTAEEKSTLTGPVPETEADAKAECD